jgi:hypothetical protein
MLCLCAGWPALVGPNGIQPRPRAARPYVRGAGYFLQGGQAGHGAWKVDSGALPPEEPVVSYAQFPLSFEANQGQMDKGVKSLSHGQGYGSFLRGDEAVLTLRSPSSVVRTLLPSRRGIHDVLQRAPNSEPRTPHCKWGWWPPRPFSYVMNTQSR